MKIAIDCRTIRQPQTGIGRYVNNLCSALASQNEETQFLLITLKGEPLTILTAFDNVEILETSQDYTGHPMGEIWENTKLPNLLEDWECNLFHGPSFLIPWRRTPFLKIVTIVDLIAFRYPINYPFTFRNYIKFATRKSINAADAIITPTDFVRDELLTLVGQPQCSIATIPMAPALSKVDDMDSNDNLPPQDISTSPYILFVGNLEWRKNLRTLLKAFTILKQRDDIPHKLVIIGKTPPFYKDDEALLNRHPYRESIVRLKSTGDAVLSSVYRGAAAMIFPSLCEGFGLPLVEAMNFGTPVVAADCSTAREICGDGAIYFSPEIASELADKLRLFFADNEKKISITRAASDGAEKFTWEYAAEQTHNLYKLIINRH